MTSVYLSLNSIDKVKNFVNTINTYTGDFDLASDRYVVDAKSIMGIFSLDLAKTIRLDIYQDENLEKVKADLSEYITEKSE